MKLKIEQLDIIERQSIAQALIRVAESYEKVGEPFTQDLRHLARRINHGEVLLCEWQYQENFEKCQK